MTGQALRPSQVSEELTWFDRFATKVDNVVSRAGFFAGCLLMVLLWGPSLPLFGSVDSWQLVINTTTTILTTLLVALQANTNRRADAAIQRKLNAVAEAVADLLEEYDDTDSDVTELRAAVGLELREST